MKEITAQWLNAASLDLENIGLIIGNERLTGHVAFHTQQAIEKTLKAIMEEEGLKVPKIHSLEKLFMLCETILLLHPDDNLILALDSLYTESRYPGDFGLLPNGLPNQEQAQLFYEFAKKIYKTVNTFLESKTC